MPSIPMDLVTQWEAENYRFNLVLCPQCRRGLLHAVGPAVYTHVPGLRGWHQRRDPPPDPTAPLQIERFARN